MQIVVHIRRHKRWLFKQDITLLQPFKNACLKNAMRIWNELFDITYRDFRVGLSEIALSEMGTWNIDEVIPYSQIDKLSRQHNKKNVRIVSIDEDDWLNPELFDDLRNVSDGFVTWQTQVFRHWRNIMFTWPDPTRVWMPSCSYGCAGLANEGVDVSILNNHFESQTRYKSDIDNVVLLEGKMYAMLMTSIGSLSTYVGHDGDNRLLKHDDVIRKQLLATRAKSLSIHEVAPVFQHKWARFKELVRAL